MKPKFNIGDIVECPFNGEVEGVPVVVRKRLFVLSVRLHSVQVSGVLFFYGLCDNDPFKFDSRGRQYDKTEAQMIELEPVVQEVERNNRKFIDDKNQPLNSELLKALQWNSL